jgi:hypothetical protein
MFMFYQLGMVYTMQSEIASAFMKTYDTYIVGLDDGFNLWDTTSIGAVSFVEPGRVNEIFCTAKEQCNGMNIYMSICL